MQITACFLVCQYFATNLGKADYEDNISLGHGRIEVRRIWKTTALNDYVKFPMSHTFIALSGR
jgi:hypothetical protein